MKVLKGGSRIPGQVIKVFSRVEMRTNTRAAERKAKDEASKTESTNHQCLLGSEQNTLGLQAHYIR